MLTVHYNVFVISFASVNSLSTHFCSALSSSFFVSPQVFFSKQWCFCDEVQWKIKLKDVLSLCLHEMFTWCSPRSQWFYWNRERRHLVLSLVFSVGHGNRTIWDETVLHDVLHILFFSSRHHVLHHLFLMSSHLFNLFQNHLANIIVFCCWFSQL